VSAASQDGRRVRAPEPLFWLSALLAAALLAALHAQDLPLRLGLATDVMHHMASVRELAKGEWPPRHNLVAAATPQGHYGPYLVALGWASRIAGALPRRTLAVAGVLNLILFALAFRALTLRLLGPGAARWSVIASILLVGPWPGASWAAFAWPGPTSLADAQNFFFPQTAAIILMLVVLARVIRPAATPPAERRTRALADLGLSALVAFLLITTHPLTAVALLPALASAAVAWWLRGEASPRRLLVLAGIPLAGFLLGLAWPFYPLAGLLRAFAEPAFRYPLPGWPQLAGSGTSALVTATGPTVDLLPLLPFLGPAALGLVEAVVLAWRRRPFLLIWFAIHTALCLVPLVPLRTRLFLFAVLPLQIALAGLLERLWAWRWAARLLVFALLVSGAASNALRVSWLLHQEVPDLGFVVRLTPDDAIVLSDPVTSNGVAGLAGRKVVSPLHPGLFLLMSDGPQRTADVESFFAPGTRPERRAAIVERWHVTHVLADPLLAPLPGGLPCAATHREHGYVLCTVDRARTRDIWDNARRRARGRKRGRPLGE
jgi:hypothetical protein